MVRSAGDTQGRMGALLPTDDDGLHADLDLLMAWRGGDQGAGLKLFRRYYGPLYHFFDSKIRQDVEELITQTFEICIERRDHLDGVDRFKVLLFGVARAQLYDHLRQHHRAELTAPVDPSSMSIEELGGLPATHGADRDDLLQTALPRIPLQSQLLLEMYLRDRFSPAQLSHVMSKPKEWVDQNLETARRALEDKVSELAGDDGTRELFLSQLSQRFEQRAS